MEKEEIERITISLKKELLKELDNFCEKNYGLKRSTAIARAVKKLIEEERK